MWKKSRSLRALPTIAVFVLALNSGAFAAEWSVVKLSGEIWIGSDRAQPASLAVGDIVEAGASVATGGTGRILLSRGEQRILLSPNSAIELPEDGSASRVLQSAGNAMFDVDRRKNPHFSVETPFLAAVVKGTKFTVTVDEAGSEVSVVEGRVEVTQSATGQSVDVTPGQRAEVTSTGSTGIVVRDAGTSLPFKRGIKDEASEQGWREAMAPSGAQDIPAHSPDDKAVGKSVASGGSAGSGLFSSAGLDKLDRDSWLVFGAFALFVAHIGGRRLISGIRKRKQRKTGP